LQLRRSRCCHQTVFRYLQEWPRDDDVSEIQLRPHGGQSKHPATARQSQKESLRQIIAMVGKHEMARPHPAAGFQEQSVAGGPGRAFDIGRRAWSGPYKYARLETALPRDGHDRICLSPRSAPQPMIDGQHNHAMQTPPTADGVEERQRVGAAGNSERHQAGVGERSKKRVEFFVGERRYGRIVSRRHWLVRP
jgi:hypothetical protein